MIPTEELVSPFAAQRHDSVAASEAGDEVGCPGARVAERLVEDSWHDVQSLFQIDRRGLFLMMQRAEMFGDEPSDWSLVPALDVH